MKIATLLALCSLIGVAACDSQKKPLPTLYSPQRIRCTIGKDKPDTIYEPAYHVTIYRSGIDFYYQGVEMIINPAKICMSSVISGYPKVEIKQNYETSLYDLIPYDETQNQ